MTEDEEMRMIVEELGVPTLTRSPKPSITGSTMFQRTRATTFGGKSITYCTRLAMTHRTCTSGGLMPIGLCSCAWRRSPSIGMCTRKATLLGVGNRWLTRKHICRI